MGDAILSAKGAIYVQDSSGFQANAGTITAAAAQADVIGSGTAFDTELVIGDLVYHALSNQLRYVTVVTSATAITVGTNWTTAVAAGQPLQFVEPEQLADITNVNLPQFQAAQVDTTVLDTTGFRRKRAGLIDAGSITGELFFQPQLAAHQRLYDNMDGAGTNLAWIIYMPDASDGTAIPDPKNSCFYFRGSMDQFGGEMPVDGAISANVSILIDGKPILQVGS